MWTYWSRFFGNVSCAVSAAFLIAMTWMPTGKVQVGDSLELKLQQAGDAPGGLKEIHSVRLVDPKADFKAQGFLLQQNALPTVDGVAIKVIPLKKGKATLGPFEALDAGGKVLGRVEPITLEVEGPADSESAPPDWMAPSALPVPWFVVGAWAFLILLLLGAALYGLVRFLRRKAPPAVRVPPQVAEILSPEEWAAREIAALDAQGLLEQSKFKPYFFPLSEIVKTYLSKKYNFDAVESTTEECLSGLRSATGREWPELTQMFQRMDRIKFTNEPPSSSEAGALRDLIKSWVLNSGGDSRAL